MQPIPELAQVAGGDIVLLFQFGYLYGKLFLVQKADLLDRKSVV